MTNSAILHYIYDPLCGWCYGAAPLVAAARALLTVRAHGGGMMSDGNRQRVTPQLRNYVVPHDHRIAQMTGQSFGEAYLEGLLRDTSAVFDSTPPIAAMLAAEKIAGRSLDMLSRLQIAHYVEGRRIADRDVLIEMASSIGLDARNFADALKGIEGKEVRGHIAETHRLMDQLGARSFPSFALERGGRLTAIDSASFMGRSEALGDWLKTQLDHTTPSVANVASDFHCNPEGCSR